VAFVAITRPSASNSVISTRARFFRSESSRANRGGSSTLSSKCQAIQAVLGRAGTSTAGVMT
jgi:hypothetical protein